MKRIENKRAEGYIDIIVATLVIVFLLVLLVSVFGVLTQKQDLKYMCNELTRTAAVNGRVGVEVQERFRELCEETGLSPTVEFGADYFDNTKKTVQFGEVITCKLTVHTALPGFGGRIFAFDMTAASSGLSQIYWK